MSVQNFVAHHKLVPQLFLLDHLGEERGVVHSGLPLAALPAPLPAAPASLAGPLGGAGAGSVRSG